MNVLVALLAIATAPALTKATEWPVTPGLQQVRPLRPVEREGVVYFDAPIRHETTYWR
jgi:hypothetical protein